MPATLQQPLPSGAKVSRYELREVLGAGGFGITYRAWDSHLTRDVAIKEFLPKDLALREPGITAVRWVATRARLRGSIRALFSSMSLAILDRLSFISLRAVSL